MSARVPNMKRHKWPMVIEDGTPCEDCGVVLVQNLGTPCPGKPQTEAPRIDLREGDTVGWAAAGKGTVLSIYDDIDNRRIAEVEVPGWYLTSGGHFTREDTGTPATLPIRAADLKREG